MAGELPLPRFVFRPDQPALWEMLQVGVRDVGAVIPAAILDQFAVQLTGMGAPLVISSPDLTREVLNDRADLFARDRLVRRMFRRTWNKGLAGAEGADWHRQRKAATPAFRPKAVAEQLAAFAREADAVGEVLAPGEAIDLNALASKIISRIVFSVLVDARGEVDSEAIARDVPGYVARILNFKTLDLLPLPEWLLDWLRGVNRDPKVKRIRAVAARIADNRAARPRQDMITLLEQVGPVQDNIGGLIPAAMDTTAHGLSWALYTLALRPEWQTRVALEAKAAGPRPTLDQLPLGRRVVQEVLRLYPPAPLLARCAAVDQTIAGHKVRRGQTVLVATYAMHRHPRLWDRPDEFDPDRFLPERGLTEAWMPFGTGPRMCIAAQFAQAEIAVILARLLARFELEPAGSEPEVSLRTATRSLNGLHARLLLR